MSNKYIKNFLIEKKKFSTRDYFTYFPMFKTITPFSPLPFTRPEKRGYNFFPVPQFIIINTPFPSRDQKRGDTISFQSRNL